MITFDIIQGFNSLNVDRKWNSRPDRGTDMICSMQIDQVD